MEEIIEKFLKKEGFTLSKEKIEKLSLFLKELKKWNKKVNLVSFKTDEELIKRHLLDSLYFKYAFEYFNLDPKEIFDVGSGAGFPGIPLSILYENKLFDLIEIRKKRALFLEHIKRFLNLKNVKVLNEDIKNIKKYPDLIICRAFAPLNKIEDLLSSFIKENVPVLIVRGKKLDDISHLKISKPKIFKYKPKEDFERNFILLEKKDF